MADFPIAVITDEFTQDFEQVCNTAVELGIPQLEIRTAWDKNVVDMSNDEIAELKRLADSRDLHVIAVASPVFKCTHPLGTDIDERFQQDAFQAAHTFDDQPRVLHRALEICNRLEAPILRVFSFWRTREPESMLQPSIEALQQAVAAARPRGVKIGLENEHACNLATAAETAPLLSAVAAPELGLVWDPANAYVSGVRAFPDDYHRIPAARILHVHAKDGVMPQDAEQVGSASMQWGDIGSGKVDWPGQLRSLREDGYHGSVSLETHWAGPGGDKFLGSTICAKSLQRLVAAA